MNNRSLLIGWIHQKNHFHTIYLTVTIMADHSIRCIKTCFLQKSHIKFAYKIAPEILVKIYGDFKIRDDVCNFIIFDFARLLFIQAGATPREYDSGEFCLTGF